MPTVFSKVNSKVKWGALAVAGVASAALLYSYLSWGSTPTPVVEEKPSTGLRKGFLDAPRRPKKAAEPKPESTPEPVDVDSLSPPEKEKFLGNEALRAEDYAAAAAHYSAAILLADPDSPLHIYYANRSFAYRAMGEYDLALLDARQSMIKDRTYSKAYFRMGETLADLGLHQSAAKTFELGEQQVTGRLSKACRKARRIQEKLLAGADPAEHAALYQRVLADRVARVRGLCDTADALVSGGQVPGANKTVAHVCAQMGDSAPAGVVAKHLLRVSIAVLEMDHYNRPLLARAYQQLGLVLFADRAFAEAEPCFRKLVSLITEQNNELVQKRQMCVAGVHPEPVESIDAQLAQLVSHTRRAHYLLGNALRAQNKLLQAADSYQKAGAVAREDGRLVNPTEINRSALEAMVAVCNAMIENIERAASEADSEEIAAAIRKEVEPLQDRADAADKLLADVVAALEASAAAEAEGEGEGESEGEAEAEKDDAGEGEGEGE